MMRKTMMTLLILLLVWTLPGSEAMPAQAVGEILGSVTNRIPDAQGDYPGIDSVSVCVDHHETHEVIWAEGNTTDADGRYVVRDVPAGRMTVVFRRVGYIDDPTVSGPVQLEPGETRRVDARMQRPYESQALIIRFTEAMDLSVCSTNNVRAAIRTTWGELTVYGFSPAVKARVARVWAEKNELFVDAAPFGRVYRDAPIAEVEGLVKRLPRCVAGVEGPPTPEDTPKLDRRVLADCVAYVFRTWHVSQADQERFVRRLGQAWGPETTRDIQRIGQLSPKTSISLKAQVDALFPDYKPVRELAGNLKGIGENGLDRVMTAWARQMGERCPDVSPEITRARNGETARALIDGESTFGVMSRPWRLGEVQQFERKNDYRPTQIPAGVQMVVIVVNKDNPVEGLTLAQVDAVFSSTRKLGYPESIRSWSQLGLNGRWAYRPMVLYRTSPVDGTTEGTDGVFGRKALGGGEYRESIIELPRTVDTLAKVAEDPDGIAVCSFTPLRGGVRTVPLAVREGAPFIPPDLVNEYPLASYLWLSLNKAPGGQLDPLSREFIKFVYSKPGQEQLMRMGFAPVGVWTARKAFLQVGIEPSF